MKVRTNVKAGGAELFPLAGEALELILDPLREELTGVGLDALVPQVSQKSDG